MEQHNAELRENPRQPADAADRFHHDLRGLRLQAALDQGELAARAHYPRHVIAAAEAGPMLPHLPVLAAYVRGCGGTDDDVAEWEDRWRSVSGATASPLLPTRASGVPEPAAASGGTPASAPSAPRPASPPRSAEAGIPAAASSEEAQGQAVIMAALNRFAERMAQPASDGSPAQGPATGPASTPDDRPAAPSSTAEPSVSGAGVPGAGDAWSGDAGADYGGEDASADPERRASLLRRMTGHGPGQDGGMPAWTSGAVIVAAVLICLLLILLAL